MQRRAFITLLGGVAAAWPLGAQAQQPSMPVIGLLYAVSAEEWAERTAAMRQGLNGSGFVEGRNVAIEYRWADGHFDRLPAMAADLVGRKVAVILAGGSTVATKAAMAATRSIPIVFTAGIDPVTAGFVASLNKPGGNVTGVALVVSELGSKRLELLHELIPTAKKIALLVNPRNPEMSKLISKPGRRPLAASDWRSLLSTAAPRAISSELSRLLSNRGPPLSRLVPMRPSKTSLNKLPRWLCATRCPPSRHRLRKQRPAL